MTVIVATLLSLASGVESAPRTTAVASVDGAWSRLDVVGATAGASAVFDPVRDRFIAFGGVNGSGVLVQETVVWQRSTAPVWAHLDAVDPSDPIPARQLASAIFDPVGDRMIVFGGQSVDGLDGEANDVWVLSTASGSHWTTLGVLGTPPSPRHGASAIYDAARGRMIVFGGHTAGGDVNDVWALSLAGTPRWTQLAPTGMAPSPRSGAPAIYDAANDRMIVFGPDDDVAWPLSFAGSPSAPTWLPSAGAGDPADHACVAVYDAAAQRMVVFGYRTGATDADRTPRTWTLSLDGAWTWTELGPFASGPTWRTQAAAAFDPVRREMIVYGGSGAVPAPGATPVLYSLWTLSLSGTPGWSIRSGDGGPLGFRVVTDGFVDPKRRELVVGGNDDEFPGTVAGSAALPLADVPGWLPTPAGFAYGGASIYDPRHDDEITFGGEFTHFGYYFGGPGVVPLSGGVGWSVEPGPAPVARSGASLVYDARRHRTLLAFGYGPAVTSDELLWSLALDPPHTWTQLLPPDPRPTPRSRAAMVYDPVRDRVILFGGTEQNGDAGPAGVTLRWFLGVEAGDPATVDRSADGGSSWTVPASRTIR